MLLSALLFCAVPAGTDTLKNFDIEEAVVVASPKETTLLRRQPVSVSLFDAAGLANRHTSALKDLSAYAPNFYMPDYGSRITSAVYIRGIGSRINTPAVGLYVDNVPYTDKSAYDFAFQGIDRVDVMRGPQGTLYGRNTMGGLIRIFTADPLTHHGTEVGVGWTSRAGGRRASFTTFLHPSAKAGISIGGYYNGSDGFYRNAATGVKQDGSDAGGGRLRLSWRPTDVVKIDWTASYEYSDEDACPYFLLGSAGGAAADGEAGGGTGTIAQNRPSSYRRSLLHTGLGVEHRLPGLVLSSITSFQHLSDRLFLDQDFTAQDIFSLCQQQQMNTVTEEIVLRSRAADRRWTWTTGLFAMYQSLHTQCPVTFYGEGVDYLNAQMTDGIPSNLGITLGFTGEQIAFRSRFRTPSANAALFHQSTVELFPRLSVTLGVRVDYDYREMRLAADAGTDGVPYHFAMSMGPAAQIATDLSADPSLGGRLRHDKWQVLPKAALHYDLPRGLGNVYLSVAKGYRSGGYNIQSYSDLAETQLRRQMMTGVRDYSASAISAIPNLPEATKQRAIAAMTATLEDLMPAQPGLATLYYKPEYTWSYEVGLHHNLAGRTLQLDLSAFYMKTRDQQISRFAASGYGRATVNAGRSRSCGVEVSLRSLLLAERLSLSANYGFTDARFTDYDAGTDSQGNPVSYTDNRVPFVPAHTFSCSADFRQPLRHAFFRAVSAGLDVKGAGDVAWDEANSFSQKFYATLGARLCAELAGNVSVEVWGRNLTAARYATFSFESMGHRFAQYAAPRHYGIDVKVRF